VSRCSGKEIGKPGEGYIVAVSVAFWFKCSSSVAIDIIEGVLLTTCGKMLPAPASSPTEMPVATEEPSPSSPETAAEIDFSDADILEAGRLEALFTQQQGRRRHHEPSQGARAVRPRRTPAAQEARDQDTGKPQAPPAVPVEPCVGETDQIEVASTAQARFLNVGLASVPCVGEKPMAPSLAPSLLPGAFSGSLSDSDSTEDSDLTTVRRRVKKAFCSMNARHKSSHVSVCSEEIESTFLLGSGDLLNLLILDLERALEDADDDAAATQFTDALLMHFTQLDNELKLSELAGDTRPLAPSLAHSLAPTLVPTLAPSLAAASLAFNDLLVISDSDGEFCEAVISDSEGEFCEAELSEGEEESR
jgi:hypothetical protein